jgi:hypothetical protein
MRARLIGVLLAAVGLCAFVCAGQVSEPPDLTGRWVMVQVMPAVAQLPFLGEVELTTVTAVFVDVEQRGTELVMQDTYCFTDVETEPPAIQSEVPQRFIDSLAPSPRRAELRLCSDGWHVVQPVYTEVRGATLADPETDPLPRDPYDPRVVDQDGDGHPGMTIPVTVAGLVHGDTYVVHRLRYSLDGKVIDANTVAGRIDWTSEQNVLAATDLILTLPYSAAPHPDPTRHVFVMERVDETWTPERARAELPRLLSLLPDA